MYGLTANQLFAYSTEVYLPIMDNQVTTVAGAVYTATVDTPGNNYTGSPAGVVNQLPHTSAELMETVPSLPKSLLLTVVSPRLRLSVLVPVTSAHVDFSAGHVYQSLGTSIRH